MNSTINGEKNQGQIDDPKEHLPRTRVFQPRAHEGRVYGAGVKVFNYAKEMGLQKIPFQREVGLRVKYQDEIVGSYRPDFVINDKVIVELKAVEFMPKSYTNQLLHYLKTTGFELGLLVNFGSPKLEIQRLVWTPRGSAINPRRSKTV